MKSKNHNKIMSINRQIEKLERERDKLFEEDSKEEYAAKEAAWKRENASAIEFCKKLVGKPFTFGNDIIKHEYWKPFDDIEAIEYDYVCVYFPLFIQYVDKYKVYISCRRLDVDNHQAILTERHYMTLRASYLDGTYKPSDHETYKGAVHILTDAELKVAFEFWVKRASEIYASEFTKKTNRPWECKFKLDECSRIFNGFVPCSKKTAKEAESAEDEKFRKDREAVLSARKTYISLAEKSEFAGILRAMTDRDI